MLLLQDVKQKLLDTYNKIEETVLSSIADKKKVIFEKISVQQKSVRHILNDTEHQSSCIEQVEKFGTEVHAVLVQRKIQKEPQTRLQSSVVDIGRSRTRSFFKCTANTCLDTLLIEIKNSLQIDDMVCDVSEKGSDSDIKQASIYAERSLQLQSEISLDEKQLSNSNNYPYSCIWIDHHIVVALDTPPSVVVFHEDNETVLSRFNCQSIPWSVSKTGQNDMVITFPRQRKISFAQLRNGNVHLVAEMTTSVPYKDVARDTALNQFICLANSEGQIDVLNNDGSLLHTLSLSSEIKQCITSSHYLAVHVNFRILFLTNKILHEITAISFQGKKLFEYADNKPLACAMDPSGDVYAVCLSGNIHQISPTGQYKKSLLLKEIDAPRGLCFNDTFDKLAIVGGLDKCYLKLYKYI
ncbi:hypothetical protein DPMN_156365 [Dreissena polymorpha]|uniref:Uncharacterized protein n=2 Tax=Dreissena polymorpha TaxID=45954 RepID=A0A9D4J7I6_DREPO|nr:hypothetical protein DPMN_156365 [Dreissena polymorpha]